VRDPFSPGCVFRDLKDHPTKLWIRRKYVPILSSLITKAQATSIIKAAKDPESYQDKRNDILDLPRLAVLDTQYVVVYDERPMPSYAEIISSDDHEAIIRDVMNRP